MRVAALIALGFAACAPCDDGTVQVTVTLPDFALAADHFEVGVGLGVHLRSTQLHIAHSPGQRTGTFAVPIASYRPGEEVTLYVEAWSQGTLLLDSWKSLTLPPGCGTLAMDLGTTELDEPIEGNVRNKVDLLFMIDNSPSVAPQQNELKARFPQLIKILEDFGKAKPAWYHIGVVTSDLGAGQFNLGGGQCHPDGLGGKLQALGQAADPTCVAPTRNLNFIDYNQLIRYASGNADSNLPAGQDLATSFGCMASVGQMGCGFEHPLESVYRALHDPPPENHDFLRDDASLFVVWLTDEDDCSAPPDTDLFDPTKVAEYGALLSYRCTQYGIWCGTPPMPLPYGDTMGTVSPCSSWPPEDGGKLIDINRYIDFFSKPASEGGVKRDPADVTLVGITGPSSAGVSVKLVNTSLNGTACPQPIDGKTCAVWLQPSCIAPQNTQFTGDPAVRINQVIGAMPTANQQLTSICDTTYQSALEGLGQKIISKLGSGCINWPFADPKQPTCTVEDVTATQDGYSTVVAIRACTQSGGATPCWKLDSKPVCGGSITVGCCNPVCAADGAPGQHFGVAIDRGPGGQPPPNSSPRVRCTTLTTPSGTPFTCGSPL
jgi:hypothetical protein